MNPIATQPNDGRWHLAIGDPTAVGWLVFVAYALCALTCWRAYRSCRFGQYALARSVPSESVRLRRVALWWLCMAVLLSLLAINKQLDLQTLMTEVGRDLALAQGWYADRQRVQVTFIAILGLAFASATLALAWWLRSVMRRIALSVIGLTVTLSFVLLRAAEFQRLGGRLDQALDTWGWLAELLGSALIGAAALRAAVPTRRATA